MAFRQLSKARRKAAKARLSRIVKAMKSGKLVRIGR